MSPFNRDHEALWLFPRLTPAGDVSSATPAQLALRPLDLTRELPRRPSGKVDDNALPF